MDEDYQAHMVMIRTELVKAPICLLLGGSSLDAAEAVLQFGKSPFMPLPKILGDGIRIPLNAGRSGHYAFNVYPPTVEDHKCIASASLEEDTWSTVKANLTINYVLKEPNPTYEPLLDEKILINVAKNRKKKGKDIC